MNSVSAIARKQAILSMQLRRSRLLKRNSSLPVNSAIAVLEGIAIASCKACLQFAQFKIRWTANPEPTPSLPMGINRRRFSHLWG